MKIINKDRNENWEPRLMYYKRNTTIILTKILRNKSLIDKYIYISIKEYDSNHE